MYYVVGSWNCLSSNFVHTPALAYNAMLWEFFRILGKLMMRFHF